MPMLFKWIFERYKNVHHRRNAFGLFDITI